MLVEENDIVTIDLSANNPEANTYIVAKLLSNDQVLLSHPLSGDYYIIKNLRELNTVPAREKSPFQRCLEYAKKNSKYLDFQTQGDVKTLCISYGLNRTLSKNQKQSISGICGIIASIHCNDDLNNALDLVNKNKALLDDHNRMWYSNFIKFFEKKDRVKSKSQRISIFNIAGFVLAQLYTN